MAYITQKSNTFSIKNKPFALGLYYSGVHVVTSKGLGKSRLIFISEENG